MANQKQMVLDYIREFGSITPVDAFKDLGVTRLAAVVFALREMGTTSTRSVSTHTTGTARRSGTRDTASEGTREMKIKLDKGAFMPVRAHDTDAGADLRSPVETVIPAGCSCIIDTGVHIHTGIIIALAANALQ